MALAPRLGFGFAKSDFSVFNLQFSVFRFRTSTSNYKHMIACFDVFYHDKGATAAAVTIPDWKATEPSAQYIAAVSQVGEYEPGEFYKRELAPLQEVIKQIQSPIQYYVIDAYCHLTNNLDPGLGAYLHEALPENSIVIGVAKNCFRGTNHAVELLRRGSIRPLYVTSIGIKYQEAADLIDSMEGKFRFPTILKEVDRLSRSTCS